MAPVASRVGKREAPFIITTVDALVWEVNGNKNNNVRCIIKV